MNKKGFTLIELLIVIVIIGVLAGLIISVLRNTDSAKEANVARSMHRLRLLAEEMKNTSGDYKNLSLAEEIYNLDVKAEEVYNTDGNYNNLETEASDIISDIETLSEETLSFNYSGSSYCVDVLLGGGGSCCISDTTIADGSCNGHVCQSNDATSPEVKAVTIIKEINELTTSLDFDFTEEYSGYTAQAPLMTTDGYFLLDNETGLSEVSSGSTPFVLEYDGYTYPTLELPSGIIWMADNMRSTDYSSGGSCCMHQNSANCDTYGRLYTRSASLTVCPEGWDLPSDDEWKELEGYFGMSETDQDRSGSNRGAGVGAIMKEDFNIDMSGYMLQFCLDCPNDYDIGEGTGFWTATCAYNCSYPWTRLFIASYTTVTRSTYVYAADYLHVRCVQRP